MISPHNDKESKDITEQIEGSDRKREAEMQGGGVFFFFLLQFKEVFYKYTQH